MRRGERNNWLKGRTIALALALIVLPICARLLNSSPSLAAQGNSNHSPTGTIKRRNKKARNSSNINRATDRRAAPIAAQDNNGQTSNSNGQQLRLLPYKVEDPKSDVMLEKIMAIGDQVLTPEMIEPIGAEITYKTFFQNQGNAPSRSLSIIDPIQDRTDFKIGSVINNLGTTGLKVSVGYSKNGGETCDYTPVSGAGGAPAGFDRLVNAVCWSFTGDLGFTAPNNAGNISYIGRRR